MPNEIYKLHIIGIIIKKKMYETTHNTMEIKNASTAINFDKQINYKLRVVIPIFCYISNHMPPGK